MLHHTPLECRKVPQVVPSTHLNIPGAKPLVHIHTGVRGSVWLLQKPGRKPARNFELWIDFFASVCRMIDCVNYLSDNCENTHTHTHPQGHTHTHTHTHTNTQTHTHKHTHTQTHTNPSPNLSHLTQEDHAKLTREPEQEWKFSEPRILGLAVGCYSDSKTVNYLGISISKSWNVWQISRFRALTTGSSCISSRLSSQTNFPKILDVS